MIAPWNLTLCLILTCLFAVSILLASWSTANVPDDMEIDPPLDFSRAPRSSPR